MFASARVRADHASMRVRTPFCSGRCQPRHRRGARARLCVERFAEGLGGTPAPADSELFRSRPTSGTLSIL